MKGNIVEKIVYFLPLVRLVSVVFVTLGVTIAVMTFITNRIDKRDEKVHKKSSFYLERCEDALKELWKNFTKTQLDEIGNYTIVEILNSYDELKKKITVEEHKHALNLTESRYINLIYNVISQADLKYVVGLDIDVLNMDFDDVYKEIKIIAESSLPNNSIIKGSNYFYGHLMYKNGASTELFEVVAAFISDKEKDTVASSYKNNQRALKSLRRKLPVFMAAYSYLVGVEQKRELTDLPKPISTVLKTA
ncbi:hypothetical protein GLP24_00675 [Photobacterium carnosum]|uniref:hypothetical protein n=1 Tax=Photobacterium carnosum TaxID=2023717 RepID=UPI001E56F807|nr:hypothetical protein [Photobacterium carnosum]MCD9543401.1 hypothetical protein [Photobacterium carnosum]